MAISKDDLPKIGAYVLDGLNLDEACILAGFLPKELKELMDKDVGAKAYFEKQQIQYKHEHLKIINKGKSDKNSMWLLEKTRPEQFGARAKRGEEDPLDVFKKLIREIQTSDEGIIEAEVIDVTKELSAGAQREGVRGVLN